MALILPIRCHTAIGDAIRQANRRDRPLAPHFGSDDGKRQHVLVRTTSGGATLDDVIFQVSVDDLPFGGSRPSGMGACHGIVGFRTFSHADAIDKRSQIEVVKLAG